jgi:hypothetical protein
MKKILGLILLALFTLSIFYSITYNIETKTMTDSAGYASIIPIPPPEPPARRGC